MKKRIYKGGRMSGKSIIKIDDPEMTPLEALEKLTNYGCSRQSEKMECKEIIGTALKQHKVLMESHPLNCMNNKALSILKREFDFSFKKIETDGRAKYEILFIGKGNKMMKSYISIYLENEDEFNILKEVLG